ncbi:DUF6401 family natural product biosynthesis protein [Kitasatospora sp. A2-31]|uniref:DUF6401 family natural product biosynthesis protein n=1 Tax=Kitasatospora sp. A2-31 TaxID=2916414 RepID=UPI001EEBD6EA|nr:DUF6401 family natural product biosynthesis protein [Kitasatospora sp. A2-31]MCG6498289.1 DUF6401 family natural product biosynthesis protein [Kitasatospora sp. A2-31]
MFATPDEFRRRSAQQPAGCPLPWIAAAFGPRLAGPAVEPGFLAAVDQHAAAVRELLYAQGPELLPRRLGRADLSDYALGLLDALAESGGLDRAAHEYAVHRLTAVCWLAREHGLLAP